MSSQTVHLNAADEPFRVCTHCRLHHVKNCYGCFGYGLKETEHGRVPVIAKEAINPEKAATIQSIACDECGSTIKGYQGEIAHDQRTDVN
jgi:hypothetical protein